MDQHGIKPERITKPIQLLAAWLAGMFVTNASFLFAAREIHNPSWGAAVLLIAAVVNVPVFIFALFMLQTKFRPQMQEDHYYSKFLDEERKVKGAPQLEQNFDQEIAKTVERIVASLGASARGKEKPISDILHQGQVESLSIKHGGSRSLSELLTASQNWEKLIARFGGDPLFEGEFEGLVKDGLVWVKDGDRKTARLTRLGRLVAKHAQRAGKMFYQLKPDRWSKMQKVLEEAG
ncbi:hypothetical protein I5W42_05690 [Stenotrophomonas maltophilia]|nr:hypothetical protein [Stenotrophomonas maltophilia]